MPLHRPPADPPTQLYAFDLKKAEQKLLASPLIANAKIKRLPPSALYIDYEVRKPLFYNIFLVGHFEKQVSTVPGKVDPGAGGG